MAFNPLSANVLCEERTLPPAGIPGVRMSRRLISFSLAGLTTVSLLIACSSGSSSGGGGATAAGVSSGSTAGTGSGSGSSPPAAPTSATPPGPPVGRWYKGDLHSHSAPYSQDADRQLGDDPGTCFFLAETAGLDFLALTDHRTFDQTRDPTYRANTLTILNGCEWGGPVHIGMVGLTQDLPYYDVDTTNPATVNAQVQAIYDEVHRQGGVVITNHPTDGDKAHVYLSHSFDAVEVWNIYWNFPTAWKDGQEADVDQKLRDLGLSGIGEDANPEIREAMRVQGGGQNHQALKFYEANLMRGRKIAAVGGGDRHSLTFPGLPTTYVFAEDQSAPKLLEGIKKARTWVGAHEGPIVDFSADGDGDGVYEAFLGDSVPLQQAVTFRLRVQNAQHGKVEVIKDGAVLRTYDVLSPDDTYTFTDTASARSWYRVDVWEKVDLNVPSSSGFQVLALFGSLAGQQGTHALTTLAAPLGFQVSIGTTRVPQVRLPHAYDQILNFDRLRWGYSRGAITSPIWAE